LDSGNTPSVVIFSEQACHRRWTQGKTVTSVMPTEFFLASCDKRHSFKI